MMKFETDLQLANYCASDYFPDVPALNKYDVEVSATIKILWKVEIEEKKDGLHGIYPFLYSITGELEVEYSNEEGDPVHEEYIDITKVIDDFRKVKPEFEIQFNPEITNNQLYLNEIEIDFRDKTIEIT